MAKKKLKDFDTMVVEMLKSDPKGVDHFLQIVYEEYEKDGDEAALLAALGQATKAKGGFSKLAKKTGLARESLYKTLSPKGNPRLKNIRLISQSLGYKLKFVPV